MLCQNCNENEAAILINRTVNGNTESYSLCRDCARKLGIGGFGLLSGLGILGALENIGKIASQKSPDTESKAAMIKRCGFCGTSFEDIESTGRVGCTGCYNVFESELADTVTGLHGIASYIGRRPAMKIKIEDEKPAETENEPVTELTAEPQTPSPEGDLRQQLLDAVKAENYEEAARLRDIIRASEEGRRE